MSKPKSSSSSSLSTSNETASEESNLLDYKHPEKNRITGLHFSVKSPANGKTVTKYIRLESKNNESVRMFTLHTNEVYVLQMLDHLKQNPSEIQNQDYKYFGNLFMNLPTGNNIKMDDHSIRIIQKRFNGMTLADFIDNNKSPIMLAFVLIMIYVEIHKLYILGITHNDLHYLNILIVNTLSADRWANIDEYANRDIIRRIQQIPNNLGDSAYIAKLDKIMQSMPIRIKIIDFDRATIHNKWTTIPAVKEELLSYGMDETYMDNPYILSTKQLNPANDISLATVNIIINLSPLNLKKKQRAQQLEIHGSLKYIYLHQKSNIKNWTTVYEPQLFQVRAYADQLTPMKCISTELSTIVAAFNSSKQIPNTMFGGSFVPTDDSLMASEKLSPQISSPELSPIPQRSTPKTPNLSPKTPDLSPIQSRATPSTPKTPNLSPIQPSRETPSKRKR